MDKDQTYIRFLETINSAKNTEELLSSSLEIIGNAFNADRTQIWEKSIAENYNSIFYEHITNKKDESMLKYRIKELTLNKNIWKYANTKDAILNKFKIASLAGIEFDNNKYILIVAYKKDVDFNKDDFEFLNKLKNVLENELEKIDALEKYSSENKKLIHQNGNLREKEQGKINFINNLAHELKTPLSSILGFSKILTTKKCSVEKYGEIADQINQAASRLSNLVNDFLQINKLEREDWNVCNSPTNIEELIKNSVTEFSSLHTSHKIIFKTPKDLPTINTDPKLVMQILDNLILNAIKYSPLSKDIEISINFNNKKECTISVSDKGIGIPKDEYTKIFNRFYRAKNANEANIPGSGLGLSICQEIISALNGKIYVESEPQKGSKFSFTIPV